jgi:hypothetical protein
MKKARRNSKRKILVFLNANGIVSQPISSLRFLTALLLQVNLRLQQPIRLLYRFVFFLHCLPYGFGFTYPLVGVGASCLSLIGSSQVVLCPRAFESENFLGASWVMGFLAWRWLVSSCLLLPCLLCLFPSRSGFCFTPCLLSPHGFIVAMICVPLPFSIMRAAGVLAWWFFV